MFIQLRRRAVDIDVAFAYMMITYTYLHVRGLRAGRNTPYILNFRCSR